MTMPAQGGRLMTNESDTREKLAWMASAAKALAEVEQLRDILATMVDTIETFGDPRLEADWNATMARAYRALGRDEWEEQ